MATGVAVLSTLAASRTEELLSAGRSEAAALTGGYQLAFGAAAALLMAAFTVALIVLRRPKPDTAAQDEPSTGPTVQPGSSDHRSGRDL
ncbi:MULTISPECIES: hypothetical protein [unclassified Streptosporangium]|uniref:hypothetical protein n=1 Tax=unclassified Streptosporangium TaxID=2632669 RepID=UPI002DDA8C0B|nr:MULTISPECIES: hypothetical protein [unclassified Streptosporangium]